MNDVAERVLSTRLAGCGARSPRDTARAVAGFAAAQALPEGTREAEYADSLAFFALSGAGETDAAAIWRKKFLGEAAWLDALDASRWSGGISYEAWALFASGALQLSREPWHGGGTPWRLDFARLGEKGRETLALALYPGLRGILGILADGLEAAGGRGTVGLAGLSQDGAAGGEDAGSVLAFCRRELEAAAMARRWPHEPEVVLLDWAPAKHPPRG